MTTGQYVIIRFSPDPVRDEPLNIGLVMTGGFGTRIVFPEPALERAARWCTVLDGRGLVAMRHTLVERLERQLRVSEDLGESLRPDFLGELLGPVSLTEPRWIDVPSDDPVEVEPIVEYLLERLVNPPKQVSYVGGTAAARKLAEQIYPTIRAVRPEATRDTPLVGKSSRQYLAEIYAGGAQPLLVSTLVLSSSWQGIRAAEAKAFELADIGHSLRNAHIAVCCQLPAIDPEGVAGEADKIFRSVDVDLRTPATIRESAATAGG